MDLNTATVEQLDTPSRDRSGDRGGDRRVARRQRAVHSVDQLGDVDGIGPARLEKLRDLVHA